MLKPPQLHPLQRFSNCFMSATLTICITPPPPPRLESFACGLSKTVCFWMEGQEGAGNQDLTGTSPALKDAVEHFRSIGWTREVLDKQQYRPKTTSFRIGKLEPQEDTFFGQTLNSSLTISHWLFLVHQDFSPHPENSVSASSKVPLQSSPPVHTKITAFTFYSLELGYGDLRTRCTVAPYAPS